MGAIKSRKEGYWDEIGRLHAQKKFQEREMKKLGQQMKPWQCPHCGVKFHYPGNLNFCLNCRCEISILKCS